MILVSGCPRSGTSLAMDILRASLGEDNIIGSKFMQEELPEITQVDGEKDSHFMVRQYIFEKSKEMRQKKLAERTDVKDMNPNGFWECEFSVQGIKYTYGNREWLKDLYDNGKNKICKIVSQGLLKSDPKYIDKIIYLIRHPRNVAKSQERLGRKFDMKFGDETKNIFDDLVVHTPEMYIEVTLQACMWLEEFKDVPILFVEFEELQRNPEVEIDKIAKFVGYGDFSKGKSIVEPKLNRSKQEDIENPLWEDAEFIYENFKKGKFKKILDAFKDPKRKTNRLNHKWVCTRNQMTVDSMDCEKCINNPLVRENFKKRAEILEVDYLNEPCLYECGMNVDLPEQDCLTIEESITYNSWAEDDEDYRQLINVYSNMEGCCDNEDNAIKEGDVVVSIKGM